MTKILKSRYKQFKRTGVRFNARRSRVKMTLNKLNLRLWDNLEFKRAHKRSRHPKANDTLWRLNYKNKQEIKAFYGGISELTYQRLNKKVNVSRQLRAQNLSNSHTSVTKGGRSLFLAAQQRGSSSSNLAGRITLLNLFETRLDVVVFKLNWAMSIYHAKQLISHGHIQVNGKKVKTPSYILQPNDLIQVASNPQSRKLIKKILIKKISRINSIIEFIYFKRIPYYLGGITNLRNKFEYWLFLPLSLEVDYRTMSAILVFNNLSTPVLFPLAKG